MRQYSDYEKAASTHHYRMTHDMSYWIMEEMETRKAESAPSLASLNWLPPEPVQVVQPSRDVDSNGYERIKELEKNVDDLRMTITRIYKALTEGTPVYRKVTGARDMGTVDRIKDKGVQDALKRARENFHGKS